MAEISRPSPVKLVVGAIFASEGVLVKAKSRLKKRFGPIDFESRIVPFNYTDYYQKEMGRNLKRQFFSFQGLISPKELAQIKRYANRLEKNLSCSKGSLGRRINLDPGYVTDAKLVLATCKNYSHRIYLDQGIFAEVTLQFHDDTFKPWPWTYPDYRSREYIQNFNAIREIYLRQLFHGLGKYKMFSATTENRPPLREGLGRF
jgi:hypothetical protein